MSNLFKKKTKQTTNQTQNSSFNTDVTKTAPKWIEDPTRGFIDEIGGLSKIDPASLVPGANERQTGAADVTGYVMGANAPRTQAVRANKYIADYMDPYLKEVIDATAADWDADAGDARAQFNLDNANAFGGSGAFLGQAKLNEGLVRGKNTTLGGLRSQGFTQALGAAQQDAARAQAANDLNAQLYAGQMDRSLGASGQLFDMGEALRGLDERRAQAPIDLLKTREDLFAGLPLDMFGGQTSTGTSNSTMTGVTKGSTSDPMGDAAKIAQVAALFYGSDRTIKTDIVKLFTRPDGLGVYLFRYANETAKRLWGAGWKVGVMAQEVLKVKPHAVARHPSGFLMVNYGEL